MKKGQPYNRDDIQICIITCYAQKTEKENQFAAKGNKSISQGFTESRF